jgi:hypothetical protein
VGCRLDRRLCQQRFELALGRLEVARFETGYAARGGGRVSDRDGVQRPFDRGCRPLIVANRESDQRGTEPRKGRGGLQPSGFKKCGFGLTETPTVRELDASRVMLARCGRVWRGRYRNASSRRALPS